MIHEEKTKEFIEKVKQILAPQIRDIIKIKQVDYPQYDPIEDPDRVAIQVINTDTNQWYAFTMNATIFDDYWIPYHVAHEAENMFGYSRFIGRILNGFYRKNHDDNVIYMIFSDDNGMYITYYKRSNQSYWDGNCVHDTPLDKIDDAFELIEAINEPIISEIERINRPDLGGFFSDEICILTTTKKIQFVSEDIGDEGWKTSWSIVNK